MTALVGENSSENLEVRAPYGKVLSDVKLESLLEKYER